MTASGSSSVAKGNISAIDPTLDPATRAVKVRATMPHSELLPGSFVSVEVVLPERPRVVAIPVTAVVRAAYGDSVFVVEPQQGAPGKLLARQQFVRLGQMRGDYVAILQGVEAGQQVVTSGAFKLRNGAPITIDNSVKPKAEPRPSRRIADRHSPTVESLATMKLTDLFIRRPVLAIVVNLVIIIAGLQAIRSLNVRQYPRLESATVTVRTAYVGASADLVRGFITTPLERAIAAADGIDYIESQSAQGLSTINVRLKLNFDAAERPRRHQRARQPGARRPAPRGGDPGDQHRAVGRRSSRRCT